MFCLRKDKEGILTEQDKQDLIALVKNFNINSFNYDLSKNHWFLNDKCREFEIEDAINTFQTSGLVITDRLHGMIFAAITGTPCIALSNFNQRVKGSYEWIKNLNYIKFIENVEDKKIIEHYLVDMLKIDKTIYDNSKLMPYFEKIRREITVK